jgi:hypothetical protein
VGFVSISGDKRIETIKKKMWVYLAPQCFQLRLRLFVCQRIEISDVPFSLFDEQV